MSKKRKRVADERAQLEDDLVHAMACPAYDMARHVMNDDDEMRTEVQRVYNMYTSSLYEARTRVRRRTAGRRGRRRR